MVLEHPAKYISCPKCRAPLRLVEKNLNVLLNQEQSTKTVCIFVWECMNPKCKRRIYKVFDHIPDEQERVRWALTESELIDKGEIQPLN